ncbi:MAG: carboxysome shell protein [Acidithiobacillales bacterium SG8_45]|nr:MAG: carboxysome shell protein [Acidithiobacillales bacterium SG8_45]
MHPLTDREQNQRLRDYERSVKSAFDAIVPTLKRIAALQQGDHFESMAQAVVQEALGFDLPSETLKNAGGDPFDMRTLFAWAMFETYQRFSDEFFRANNLIDDHGFQSFLIDCGFHTMDVSPCADGRLAHVISFVLRLPYREVRRKSYAGAMFDIENSVEKWTETEFLRFREGRPNTADEPTRYLKTVVYHFSSSDPHHQGCAAHGSDTNKAAQAGLDRLNAFQQAVESSFCCGASIDLLLIGLDTDTDTIRVHVSTEDGKIDLRNYIDTSYVYAETMNMTAGQAASVLEARVREHSEGATEGMIKLVCRLVTSNISQIDYVNEFYNRRYADIGHAERFIGAGIGFEEIQLRNLTYFAYMNTVEEATADLDVGVKIFTGLNVTQGLPIPIVIRFDYHGHVPGARDRAEANCKRVADALRARYSELAQDGLLHTLLAIRDCAAGETIEVLESSVFAKSIAGAH